MLALAEQIRNAPLKDYLPQELAMNAGLSYVHFQVLFKQIHGDTAIHL